MRGGGCRVSPWRARRRNAKKEEKAWREVLEEDPTEEDGISNRLPYPTFIPPLTADDQKPAIPGRSDAEIAYHIHLMQEAGLILAVFQEGEPFDRWSSAVWGFLDITWEGHDFLDASRNDGIWTKLTEKVRSTGGAMTFEVVKKCLELLIIEAWKLRP